jgi:hypothetical protein
MTRRIFNHGDPFIAIPPGTCVRISRMRCRDKGTNYSNMLPVSQTAPCCIEGEGACDHESCLADNMQWQ